MERITITKENRGQIISEWIKSKDYELYFNDKLIEKDIEIQNLTEGSKLIKK